MRCFLGFIFTAITFSSNAQSNLNVLNYRFQITVNDFNDSIQGQATIRFLVKEKNSILIFDLTNLQKNGKGMIATSLKFNNPRLFQPAFIQQKEKLIIKGNLFEKDDTATIIIFYKGIPVDGLIISNNKYGHRTFFADNWPNNGHNWLPCHDDPADKASVDFIVIAPDHYQVVGNGILIEEKLLPDGNKKTHWKEEIPISVKVMTVGIAEFVVNLTSFVNNTIPVSSWVFPEDKDKGFYDYAIAKDILAFFINKIGAYGFKKLANVQSTTKFGGMENANTIFYTENSITGDRKNEKLFAHEIAHQWFGNMVTEKSFAHLWLSEGFATYFAILYFENKYGKDVAINMLKEDRTKVIALSKTLHTPIIDLAGNDYMKLMNANNYQKGGWVLHMLRSQLGDSIFWAAIQKYYARYAGGIAGTDDLRKVFETVSGKDLKQFFNQWLYKPGQPLIKINWKYNSKEKVIDIRITQKHKNVFSFPLTVEIILSSGETILKKLAINKMNSFFTFPVKEKPSELVADPNTNLLFEYTLERIK